MRTPEEIKKELECCSDKDGACSICPYMCGYGAKCITEMLKDVLSYIQKLEAQVPKWTSVEERLPPCGERVRHGRWVFDNGVDHCYKFSECKAVKPPHYIADDFCPNCGAKMDLEVQHDG